MKLLKKQVRVKSRQIIINPKNQRLRSQIIINPKNQRPRKKRKRKKLKKKRKMLRQTIMNRPREKWTKTTAKVQKILTIPTELLELVEIQAAVAKSNQAAQSLATLKRITNCLVQKPIRENLVQLQTALIAKRRVNQNHFYPRSCRSFPLRRR